jgi:hypothetical protein
VSHDRDVLERAERPLRELEGRRRDVDEVDEHALAAAPQALREHRELLAASAAELDDRDRILEGFHHLGRVALEQPALGARDPVPRQPADRLEQRGAERVVKVLRLDLLRRQREVAAHVGGEVADRLEGRGLRAVGNRHGAAKSQALRTVRNFA